jgi:hypothetical protein
MFGVDASQDRPISVHAQTVKLTPDISPSRQVVRYRTGANHVAAKCIDALQGYIGCPQPFAECF